MSGEIDGHCLTLHHFFIVSLNVFTTLFLLHLHFASLDMAISGAAGDIHFLKLMHFIWSAKPSQLTSCHSGVSYDITPLALATPRQPPPPHSRTRHRPSAALSNCNVWLSPDATLLCFAGVLSAPVVLSVFHFPGFLLKNGSFWGVIFHKGCSKGPVVRNSQRPEGWECAATVGPANPGTRGVLEGLMAFWCS